MALRLIEMILPADQPVDTNELLKDYNVLEAWREEISGNHTAVKILLSVEDSEAVLNHLEKKFSYKEGFQIILLPVEAAIPRPEPPEETPVEEAVKDSGEEDQKKAGRISREELYTDIVDTTKLSRIYIVLVILSTVVAIIGILRSSVAIIIGSMVIAPLLGPNVGLSLATTLGDVKLARNAFKTNIAGLFVAFMLSAIAGWLLTIDPAIPEIASRTRPDLGDIGLSLASGGAGALAFTTGLPTALVGVMVAVALLPPLVVCGMLLGGGYMPEAFGALLLLLVNIICVNLAGVTTFLVQGIRPLSWWEADKAKKATRIAISLWISLLIALAVVIFLAQ